MTDTPSMAVSVRLQHRSLNGTAADIRHDLRIGRIPKYVDQKRTELNSQILLGPTANKMRAESLQLRKLKPKKRKMRSNAAISTRMIITFGKGLQPHFAALDVAVQDKIYREISEAVAKRLLASLKALVAHRDETAPHAHGQMLAINNDGVSVSKIATPTVTSELQDIAHEIALKYLPMCERGIKKSERIARGDDLSKIYNRSVKQLHEDLPAEIAAKQKSLDTLTAQIPDLEARVEEMQSRVDRLESNEERLTTAQEKRLITYKKRVSDRQAELAAAREEISSHKTELDGLKATIRDLEAGKAISEAESEKAAEATERAQEAQRAAEAALTPWKQKKADLAAEIQTLAEQQARSQAAARKAALERAAAEAAMQQAVEGRRRAAEATERAQEAQRAAEAALTPWKQKKADLAAEIAGLESKIERGRKMLDFMALTANELRPAHDIAHALRRIAQDTSQDQECFDRMIPPHPGINTAQGRDTWATALRMADPFFAPDVAPDVPRAPDPEVNLATLVDTDTSVDNYDALVNAMKSEPGDHHSAVSALVRGNVKLSDLRTEAPGVSWVARAFAGLKRGLAFAVEKVSERSVALAGVFEALPFAAQAALSRLISTKTVLNPGQYKEDPQLRDSIFDFKL